MGKYLQQILSFFKQYTIFMIGILLYIKLSIKINIIIQISPISNFLIFYSIFDYLLEYYKFILIFKLTISPTIYLINLKIININ